MRRRRKLPWCSGALNRIIDVAVPEDWQEGGTMVSPGRAGSGRSRPGRVPGLPTIIRDRGQDMVAKGMTLEQVKAARPTFE